MSNLTRTEELQEFIEFFSKLDNPFLPPQSLNKYNEGLNRLKIKYQAGSKYDKLMAILKSYKDFKGNVWELIDFLDNETYYKLSSEGQIFYNKGGFIGEAKRKKRKEFWDGFTSRGVVIIALASLFVNIIVAIWNIKTTSENTSLKAELFQHKQLNSDSTRKK